MGYQLNRSRTGTTEHECDTCGSGNGSDGIKLCQWCCHVEASFGGDLGNPLFSVIAKAWRAARDVGPYAPDYPDAPVLDAQVVDHDRWRVWCAFCERWHTHSASPGHRVAHCHNPASPYADTGYVLRRAAAREATA